MYGADDKVRDDTGLPDSDCRWQPMMSNASLPRPGPQCIDGGWAYLPRRPHDSSQYGIVMLTSLCLSENRMLQSDSSLCRHCLHRKRAMTRMMSAKAAFFRGSAFPPHSRAEHSCSRPPSGEFFARVAYMSREDRYCAKRTYRGPGPLSPPSRPL